MVCLPIKTNMGQDLNKQAEELAYNELGERLHEWEKGVDSDQQTVTDEYYINMTLRAADPFQDNDQSYGRTSINQEAPQSFPALRTTSIKPQTKVSQAFHQNTYELDQNLPLLPNSTKILKRD